jgi:hypothetical protein
LHAERGKEPRAQRISADVVMDCCFGKCTTIAPSFYRIPEESLRSSGAVQSVPFQCKACRCLGKHSCVTLRSCVVGVPIDWIPNCHSRHPPTIGLPLAPAAQWRSLGETAMYQQPLLMRSVSLELSCLTTAETSHSRTQQP